MRASTGVFVAAIAGLCLVSAVALAQVPQKLGYQGRLLKADGSPEVGIVEFTYTIFDAETGGNVLWSETKKIALTDGFYSTYLGDSNELKPDLFDGRELFLEVTAAGDVLTPRQRIASVAYAIRAQDARNVVGGTVNASSVAVNGAEVIAGSGQLAGPAASAFSTPGSVNDGANPVDWSKLKGVPAGFADGVDDGITGLNATGPLMSTGGATPTISLTGCASGQILKWNGTAWACAADDSLQPTGANGVQVTGATVQLASCPVDQVWRATANGWACAPVVSSLTAVGPLTSTGGANPTIALPSTCATGQVLKWDGSAWTCSSDSVNSYAAGAGLSLSGNTFALASGCAAGQVLKFDGTTWNCAADSSATYAAGSGLALNGNTFSLLGSCASGQVLKWNGSSWACAADADTGGVTSVTASAPLSSSGGTTPNITAAQANASTSGFLSSGDWAAFNAKVSSVTASPGSGIAIGGTGTAPNVSLMSCSGSGLILKFNGTAWVCAPDDNGGGTITAVNATAPLTSTGGSTPTIALTTGCANGQVLKWNGSAWACAADVDTDTNTTYSAGSGLTLTGTTFSLLAGCASGQVLKWNGSAWACAADADTGTTYSAGSGLTLSGTTFSLLAGCSSGQVLKWNGTSWACAADTDTTYLAGSGLQLAGNSFSLPTTCAANQVMKWNGLSWACAADVDTNTTYSAGSGLQLNGTVFALPNTCTGGQIMKWNGSSWNCAADSDTTYSAGSGLQLTGTAFSLPTTCTAGQVMKWNGAAWACAADIDTNGGGTVTQVTASAPLVSSGGNTPNLSMPQAGASSSGYLSSADWNTFAAKPYIRLTYNAGTLLRGNPVPFAVAESGNGALWDVANHRFTATASGTYSLSLSENAAGGIYLVASIRKNSAVIAESYGASPDAVKLGGASVTTVTHLNAGDFVDFFYQHDNSAVPLTTAYASIHYIGL